MENTVEWLEDRLTFFSKGYFISVIIFTVVWIPRLILKGAKLLPLNWDQPVMVILAITIPFQFYFAVRLMLLVKKINRDKKLRSAVFSEMVVSYEIRAWRGAFYTSASVLVLLSDDGDKTLAFRRKLELKWDVWSYIGHHPIRATTSNTILCGSRNIGRQSLLGRLRIG